MFNGETLPPGFSFHLFVSAETIAKKHLDSMHVAYLRVSLTDFSGVYCPMASRELQHKLPWDASSLYYSVTIIKPKWAQDMENNDKA